MKNKRTTYILIVSVALVWGTIAWRVLTFKDQLNTTTQGAFAQPTNVAKPKSQQSIVLSLDYPDPFLRNNVVAEETTVEKKPPTNYNRVRLWPALEYNGAVSKNQSGKKRGLLKINQSSYLVCENDLQQGIKIVNVTNDSIGVEFENDYRCIKRFGYDN